MAVSCADENQNTLNSVRDTKDVSQKPCGLAADETSAASRLSHLSQPRAGKLVPSSAELQMRYVEAKRSELQELRRRNERSCYGAIHNPQGTPRRTTKVTVPKEFNLSRSNTPSRSVCSDHGSEAMELESDGEGWSSSLRGRGRSKSRDSAPWKPQLTVPAGPVLHTSWRPRSTSRSRGAGEQPQGLAPHNWSGSLRGGRGSSGSCSRSSSRASSRQGSAAPSPARSTRSTRSVRSLSRAPRLDAPAFEVSTPARAASRGRPRTSMMTPSPARSVQSSHSVRSCSDMSLASVGSRLSRLSRRSSSRHRGLSTADLQELDAEEGRRRLSEQLKHNARTYQQAINFPDMRRGHHSLDLTVPEEFNLSVSNRSSRSHASGNGSSKLQEGKNRAWSESLRPSESSESAWEPKLTVPFAPMLRSSSRQRSSSASRRGEEASSAMTRSMSCHRMTPREQVAVERHLQRSASVHAAAPTAPRGASTFVAQLPEEDQQWIQAAGSAEERAERARSAMQKRKDEAWKEEKHRLCVFAARSTDGSSRCKRTAAC